MFISKIILIATSTLLTAKGLNTEVVCESQQKTIACPEDSSIQIFKNGTFYGRQLPFAEVCPSYGKEVLDCTGNGTNYKIVSELCNGRSSCLLEANNNVFVDTCRHVFKYLQVKYGCTPNEITMAPIPPIKVKNKNKICIGDPLKINNPLANNPHKTKMINSCKEFCRTKYNCEGFNYQKKRCHFLKNIKNLKKRKGATCYIHDQTELPPLKRISKMQCFGDALKHKITKKIKSLKECKAICNIHACDGFNYSKKGCTLFSKIKQVMWVKRTTCFIRDIVKKEPHLHEDKFH